jgi:ABC-type antimicrobial peptide transport system permease subunit
MVDAGASFLMIVVAMLLAIVCTNLATWLLVRGLARGKEVSVRLALGASRARVVRHLVLESTLLAGLGGALGFLFAGWTIGVVAALDLPVDVGKGLDPGCWASRWRFRCSREWPSAWPPPSARPEAGSHPPCAATGRSDRARGAGSV